MRLRSEAQGEQIFPYELPVPEDWSILVEKTQATPEPPPISAARRQQIAQQQ